MSGSPGAIVSAFLVLVSFVVHGTGEARTIRADAVTSIAGAVGEAESGDTVLVTTGEYAEHGIVVERTIVLTAQPGVIVDGEEKGEVFTIRANNVVLEGFTIKNVGTSFMEDRAAVRVADASGCVIRNNVILDGFFGIYLENSEGCVIRGNVLRASGKRETTSGNGIHLWYCRNIEILANDIEGHRDGIYLEFVEKSQIRNNKSHGNLRYGLHFMFSHDDDYEGNVFSENGAGVAVMYSTNVTMTSNTFDHNWGRASFGILLKEIKDSRISGNVFSRNTTGLYAEGCNRIVITQNTFEKNGYAIKLMANSQANEFVGNNFMGNTFDVSTNSRTNFNVFRSNYWSAYDGYDLDGDGFGDVPHHPVRLFSVLVERQPSSVILMSSLFVKLIDTAERVLPTFTPEMLVDDRPSMTSIVLESTIGAHQ